MPKYVNGVTSDYLIAGKILYNNSLNYAPPVSNWVDTESITLDRTTLSFTNKESVTLVATITPSNASDPIVWKSSNTSIATVNGGLITPWIDGSCNITATSDGKTATCSVLVEFAKYTISNTLLGCSLNNETSTVVIGDSFSAEIIPSEGYSLKNAYISITMDGVDITSTAYSNGIITITEVTGDIVINVTAYQLQTYSITRNLVGCTSNSSIVSILENSTHTETFTPDGGYLLTNANVTITMGGVDIISNYSNNTLDISNVTGNIIISIEAIEIPVIEPAEWEIVRTLTSDDIMFGYGSAASLGDNTIPFTQSNVSRAGYYIPDIPLEVGYRYKVEFESPISTTNIGVQCVNQNWVNAYTNMDSSYSTASKDMLDSGWQMSGYEMDLPEQHNGALLKAMRLTFRTDSSNPDVNSGDITSVTISRRPVDTGAIVDLDCTNIVDGKLVNKGFGGNAYDAVLNTVTSSDKHTISGNTLQLTNHAYAEIPYGFNASTPFTIVVKSKINTKSSKKYQRVMRTNVDAPSLYYSTNSSGLNTKLAGVVGENSVSHHSLGDWRGSNSLIIDYGNSTKISEETNMQEYKWISDGVTIKFYFNGILLGSQDASGLSTSTSIGLGDNDTSTSYYASLMTISEFKIYNQALSV